MKKWHLWLAASIGLVVIAGMMIREFDVDALSSIDLSPGFFLGVGMAVGLFALQNLMLSLRFQHLCHRRLSLMQSFRVNVLCEFTSAVTPSAVGGKRTGFRVSEPRGCDDGKKHLHHVCCPTGRRGFSGRELLSAVFPRALASALQYG